MMFTEGPCALEYTRLKTTDHLYTDPHADELVLRHRLHSGASAAAQTSISPFKRPALAIGVSGKKHWLQILSKANGIS